MTREEAIQTLRGGHGVAGQRQSAGAALGIDTRSDAEEMTFPDAADRICTLEKAVARLSATLSTVETQLAVYRFWRA